MGDLADVEQVKPPTMSRIVAGLEDAGLVRRESDRRDGRSVRVEATVRGRKLFEKARLRRIEVLAKRLRRLPAEKLGVIADSVDILKEMID
jgi:DNA-binding MarR family transcriptional regulator